MDNARINHSNLMNELLLRVGSRPIYITPYHHQANAVERVNRTLEDTLSKYTNQNQTDWDIHLPSCTFALNTAVHASTQYSPYQIVFGRQPTLPIDVLFDVPSIPYVEKSQKVRDKVKENLLHAQQLYASKYNAKRSVKNYPVNSKVMIADWAPKPGLSKKLLPKFKGPYRILKQISPLNYRVKHMSSAQKPFITHVNRMKPFGSTKTFTPDNPSLVDRQSDDPYSSDESDDVSQFQFKPQQHKMMSKSKTTRSNSHSRNSLKLNAVQRALPGPDPDQVPAPQPSILKTSHRKVKRLRTPVILTTPTPVTTQTTRSGRIITKPIRFTY